MSGRPEPLFPLFAGLETLEGVGPKTAQNLAHLGGIGGHFRAHVIVYADDTRQGIQVCI